MAKRFWLLGLVGLVLVGFLVACGSNYNSATDGLLVVGSQGSQLLQTFRFDLNTGGIGTVANSPNDTGNLTCVLNGSPSSMVMDPAGAYAYVIFNKSTQCPTPSQTGISAFQVKSDGSIVQTGNLVSDPNPVALAMDPAGKFLFVAEGTQGVVNVYAIGSGASLAPVQSSFNLPAMPQTPNFIALAPSFTVFPKVGINGTQNSGCSIPGSTPPTSEYLYVVDTNNYNVLEFTVNTTTGALGNPGTNPAQVGVFPTDKVPAGVAVDPCDRFVYVSDSLTNKISAYTICITVIASGPCPNADGSLVQVVGSPFPTSGSVESPGPLAVDPYGNHVYVVGTLSNTVSPFSISSVTGSLTAASPATVATGLLPTSIVIRGDDNWMFITNYNAATVSQYSITPATGALNVLPAIQTDNYPWGVAVK